MRQSSPQISSHVFIRYHAISSALISRLLFNFWLLTRCGHHWARGYLVYVKGSSSSPLLFPSPERLINNLSALQLRLGLLRLKTTNIDFSSSSGPQARSGEPFRPRNNSGDKFCDPCPTPLSPQNRQNYVFFLRHGQQRWVGV